MNLLTIDIEEWFFTSALDRYVDPSDWDRLPSRLGKTTRVLLDLLDQHQTKATFFVLGWVAEHYPGLVREIHARGHEIGSHGYRHRRIYHLSKETFQEYVKRSKSVLEDLIGEPIQGYRATSFTVVKETLWALDVIREAGFVYDSSISPVRHDIYGLPGFPRHPVVLKNGLVEIPASTWRLCGQNLPIAGGGYFRIYPYWLTRMGIAAINREGIPVLVYLHPWELDPHCHRVPGLNWRTSFRQYFNLGKTKSRFEKLLSDFRFSPVRNYVTQASLGKALY